MSERLTLEILTQATGQDSVDRLTTAMNRFATASETAANKTTSAFQRTGQAAAHVVPQVAAASAAVRALEGTLSVRAVERFATDVLGLGNALQKIFPLIGGLALADVFIKGGEELYKFYQKWDPVHRAQERSVELAKNLSVEIGKIGQELTRLQFANLEKAIGSAAANALTASRSATGIQAQRNIVGGIDMQISAQQSIVKSGTAPSSIFGPGQLSHAATAAQIEIGNLQKERAEASAKLELLTAQRDQQLSDAAQKQQDDNDAASKQSQDDAKRKADQLAEQRKRAQSVADAETERSLTSPGAKAFYQYQSRLKTFDDPMSRGTVQGAYESEIAAKSQELAVKGVNSTQKGLDDSRAQDEKAFTEMLRIRIKDGEEIHEQDRKVIDLQDSLTRENGAAAVKSANSRGSFASRMPQYGNTGDPGAQLRGELQAELSTANEVYRINLETASETMDAKRKEQLFNEANLSHEEALQDIREKGIEKLAQLEQERVEKFKSGVGSVLDALMNRSFGSFLRSQVTGIGKTVVENAAGMALPAIEKMIPHATSGTLLGKLTAGTPFGPDPLKTATDLNTQATIDNTTVLTALGQLATSPTGGGGGSAGGIGVFGGGGIFSGPDPNNPSIIHAMGFGAGLGGPDGQSLPELGDNSDLDQIQAMQTARSMSGLQMAKSTTALGKAAAIGAAVGAGVSAVKDFSRGGARSDIAGVGSALGGAAAIASMIPGGQAVALGLGIASMATSFVSDLFPDPKQVRETGIQNAIAQNKYNAPTALNVTQDTSGNFVDFDARGNLRQSPFRASPQVTDPFTWEQTHGLFGGQPTYYGVPGRVDSPYAPNPALPAQPIIIQAMDAQSFVDFAQKNATAISDATATHLQNVVPSRLSEAVKYHTNN